MLDPAQAARPTDPAQQRVGVKVQYIKDLSFEVPRAPEIYVAIRSQPTTTVTLDVSSRPITGHDRTYEVTLLLRVEATASKEHGSGAARPAVEFIAELSYAGLFTMNDIPEEAIEEVLRVDCPHILYPFASNILSDLARDANFPPLLLQGVDFTQLWQNRSMRSDPRHSVGGPRTGLPGSTAR